eukprot:m.38757 g.38757  ORF g.38757 m.38757 type:complete len:145 (-) comp18008_c0_seq2:93-527(-)
MSEERPFRNSIGGLGELDRASTPRFKPYHPDTDFKRAQLPCGEKISVMQGLRDVDYDDMIATMTQKNVVQKGPPIAASVSSQDFQAPPPNFNQLFNGSHTNMPNPTGMARPGGDMSKSRRFELITTKTHTDPFAQATESKPPTL